MVAGRYLQRGTNRIAGRAGVDTSSCRSRIRYGAVPAGSQLQLQNRGLVTLGCLATFPGGWEETVLAVLADILLTSF